MRCNSCGSHDTVPISSDQACGRECLDCASVQLITPIELLKVVKANRYQLNDAHFSGVTDRLFRLIDEAIKAEGEQ